MIETRDGVRLAYRTTGEGPLLVCQAGGPGRASRYLENLGGLDRHRTLFLFDSRGTGDSDRTPDLSYEHVAADLEDVRRHLGVESFDLLGHSAGAATAMVYAATHPGRVHRLVLVTPSGRLQGVRGNGDVSRRETYGAWTEAAQRHAAHVDDEMDRVAERSFGGTERPDLVATLRTLDTPVLVVAGGADRVTPVAAAEAVAASFQDATLHVLDGVGHYPWVEAPEEFVPLVADFLGSSTVYA